MKVLILSNNNIFSSVLLSNNKDYILCDNIEDLPKQLDTNEITHVVYDYRKSYGNNIWNTNYIENHLDENIKYNLYYSIEVCNLCREKNVHLTYIGEGCIFRNESSLEPDLKVSKHSLINIYTEKILSKIFPEILYLRIRYPISGNFIPQCFLMKMLSYNKILDCNNSVTILDDIYPILEKMMEKKTNGIYNFFGNGHINSIDTIIKIKNNFDSLINFNILSKIEHDNTIGERSNGIFSNSKLVDFCSENGIELHDSNKSVESTIENMSKKCTELKYCLCCKQQNILLLDLGYQPLANDFHKLNEINNIYPLKLKFCPNCFHCQLSHSVSPKILFKNYKYVSGTSKTGKDFFKWNAEFIHEYKGKTGKILDIACNDGSQLNPFRDLGWDTYGVDPAENICPVAVKEGHTIYCDFWNDTIAKKLPIMDVITAQNVFAHTPYVDDFLLSCKKIMDNNTSLFIQTSQRDMIVNGEFDTTYHEHISFYNTKSMDTLTKRNGLVLNRVLEHGIHGRSYIFEIKLIRDDKIYDVDKHLLKENNIGLFNNIIYDKFRINAETSIMNLKLEIEKWTKKGYKSIGFGAAAKGQTLICYGDINLNYIIDESPYKFGLYSPKLNIPIVPLDHFKDDTSENILIVILAWNFAKEIKKKIYENKGNKNVVIIEKYFPKLKVC